MTPDLIVSRLSKKYGEKSILSNINITVKRGEFISIIGPNASGKSTLLKIIAGIIPPSKGIIRNASRTSYLPQTNALLPWFTVEENLLLPARLTHSPIAGERKKTHALLKEFGLFAFLRYYPHALSGGTAQKIALLRTVLTGSSCLLLDEPFASLDTISRKDVKRWLLKLVRGTATRVLLVTHDIQEAAVMSDHVYRLAKGRIKKL